MFQFRTCHSAFRLLRRHLTTESVTYSEFGDPEKVLSLSSKAIQPFTNEEVLIKACAAPINPADINTIQGTYPIKPKLPAVAGNEGVGRVVACGKHVGLLKVGDLVIPGTIASGTWQTYWCGKAKDFIKIDNHLNILHAAVLSVNPSSALHLITDFVELKKGDVIIQNGATSSVGLYVIQMAKLLGYNTVNLFRERETKDATEKTRQLLQDYGATLAVTDSELPSEISHLGRPKLALNCLGGKAAVTLLKQLDHGGTMVTYGGMARVPMPVPVGPFIFKDIRMRGFWLSRFNMNEKNHQQYKLMLDQISKWFIDGLIKPSPFTEISFPNWKKGLSLSLFGDSIPTGIREKVILIME